MHPRTLLTERPLPVPAEVAERLRGWVQCVLDLPAETVVQVSQLRCRDSGCAPVETVLAVLRPGASLARSVALPAGEVCAADVLAVFDDVPRSTP